MEGTVNLTKGSIGGQLFRLSLPVIASYFMQMFYSLTDIAWLGHYSNEAVAAVGTCGIITWIVESLSMLTNTGAEVTVGQSVGVSNSDDAKKYIANNVTIATVISLFCTVIVFALSKQIVNLFLLETDIASLSNSFLRIVSLAFPFHFISTAFVGSFNGAGNTRVPLYIFGGGFVLNMLLDPLFIYGFNMGSDGAAVATLLSKVIVCLTFVYVVKIRKVLFNGLKIFTRIDRKKAGIIFRIGTSVALLNAVYAFINMVLGRIASVNGGYIALLSFTTGSKLESLTWYTALGLSAALCAFVAQNYAAGEYKRMASAYKRSILVTIAIGLVGTIGFIFFGRDLFSLFVPDREAYMSGAEYLRISGYSQILMMVEITSQGVFYGFGRTLPPAVISVTFNVLRIPLALFMASTSLGVLGIWWAIAATSIIKGLILLVWTIVILREKANRNER